MRLNPWKTLSKVPRRVLRNVAVIVLVPGIMLMGTVYLTQKSEEPREIQIAALALAQDMQKAPPRGGWTVTDIRVNDKMRVEMDVEVAYHHQAEFIKTRSGRVQYSHLKLACPVPEARVYTHLPRFESVWVHLHYNNDHIVSGACPKTGGPFG